MAQVWRPVESPLLTRWATEVDPLNPWPAYPRPQMARDAWLNLNGLWDYDIRPATAGPPDSWPGQILVPYPVESTLSGVGQSLAPDARLWYRRSLALPQAWKKQRILLHFEAVDWEATFWIDGKEVGRHRGGYSPFSFDITDYVKPGRTHELLLRVFDPTDAGTQPRGKQVLNPGGIFYTASSGIWQTVWVEAVPRTHIADLRIRPNLTQGQLVVQPQLEGKLKAGDQVSVTVKAGPDRVATATGEAGSPLTLLIPDPRAWSPEDPFLYDLEVKLQHKHKTIDAVRSYAGLRDISLGRDPAGITRIFLNGKPYFQNGPLDQGFWPDGLYTPPTEDAMRYDLEMTREMGFNMLRKHVKVESRRFYTWCDRMGLLVWQDMPSGDASIGPQDPDIVRADSSARQYRQELTEMIGSLFNHPSIVVWVPFNEGWGQFETEAITDYVRELDPSRLIDPASGWTDRGVGDIKDIHHYPEPQGTQPEAQRAAVLGEFGGLGLAVPGHTWEQRNWGYQAMNDRQQLLSRYEQFYWEVFRLREDPGLSAVVYTQTTDVETETNGLLTYDRAEVKLPLDPLRRINRGEIIIPPQLGGSARIFLDSFQVFLQSPSPGAVIHYTLDGSQPSVASPRYDRPFWVHHTTVLKARTLVGEEASRVETWKLAQAEAQIGEAHSGLYPGLMLHYYEGAWEQLPDFGALSPARSFPVKTLSAENLNRTEDFGLRAQGYFLAPREGVYTFYLSSDDGSRLSLGETQLIDHDGVHGMNERSASIALGLGYHPLQLDFFQHLGGRGLRLEVEGPGLPRQEAGPDLLFQPRD